MCVTAANKDSTTTPVSKLQRVLLGSILSSALSLSISAGQPAMAQIETVGAQQALSLARPFAKQEVDKNRVWLLFAGASTALFVGTVAVENNSGWFPAISRANQAMQDMRKQQEETDKAAAALERERAVIDTEVAEVQRQSRLVEESLSQARAQVLGEQDAPSTAAPAAGPSDTPTATDHSAPQNGAAAAAAAAAGVRGPAAAAGAAAAGAAGPAQVDPEAAEVIREAASSYVLEAKQALAALKQQAAAAGVREAAGSESDSEQRAAR